MADFSIAYKRTNRFEGFYSNNPNDSGGETLYGISRLRGAPFPEFWRLVDEFKKMPGFPGNMKGNKQLITMKTSWYKKNYWDLLKGDQIRNQGIANQLYDISVNKGAGVAIRFLGESLGVKNLRTVTNQIIEKLNEIDSSVI